MSVNVHKELNNPPAATALGGVPVYTAVGMLAREAGYSRFQAHLGAGLAQIVGGHSSWDLLKFLGDERGDFIMIDLGFFNVR